jgi:hypothetical protein
MADWNCAGVAPPGPMGFAKLYAGETVAACIGVSWITASNEAALGSADACETIAGIVLLETDKLGKLDCHPPPPMLAIWPWNGPSVSRVKPKAELLAGSRPAESVALPAGAELEFIFRPDPQLQTTRRQTPIRQPCDAIQSPCNSNFIMLRLHCT